MTQRNLTFLLCSLILLHTSCKESDVNPASNNTNFIILSELTGINGIEGHVSSLLYPENDRTDDAVWEEKTPNQTFAEAAVHEGFAYLIRKSSATVYKYDFNKKAIAATHTASDYGIDFRKSMRFVNNELMVTYTKHLEKFNSSDPSSACYLKFYNRENLTQTDSVFIQYEVDIYAAEVIHGKIILTLGVGEGYDPFILVLDANSRKILDEFTLERAVREIIPISPFEVLLLSSNAYFRYNVNELKIKEETPLLLTLNHNFNAPMTAYDPDTKNLYHFQRAGQPSPTPYFLAVINLETKETTRLTGFELEFTSNSTLRYDKKNKVIAAAASNNRVLILDQEGKLLKEVSLPGRVTKIIAN